MYSSKCNIIIVHSSIRKFVTESEGERERSGRGFFPTLCLSQQQVFVYLRQMLRKLKMLKSKMP